MAQLSGHTEHTFNTTRDEVIPMVIDFLNKEDFPNENLK
jgi:hypothetical protein